MPRQCTICTHPDRRAIEEALLPAPAMAQSPQDTPVVPQEPPPAPRAPEEWRAAGAAAAPQAQQQTLQEYYMMIQAARRVEKYPRGPRPLAYSIPTSIV
jgi:hypothetical protein